MADNKIGAFGILDSDGMMSAGLKVWIAYYKQAISEKLEHWDAVDFANTHFRQWWRQQEGI